jgi:hypothetical protein
MIKTKHINLLITVIALLLIVPTFTFADSAWTGTDTNGVASRNGSVGIGTTNPSGLLDLEKTGATIEVRDRNTVYTPSDQPSRIILSSRQNSDTYNQPYAGSALEFQMDWNGGVLGNAARIVGRGYYAWGGTLDFDVAEGGSPQSNYVTRMRITKDGNVGIGTNNPGNYKLNIYGGNVLVDGAGYIGLMLRGTSASDLYFFDSGAAANKKLGIFRSDDGVTKFLSVNDSGSAAIQDNILVMDHVSGNVGIGTTTPGTYKLAVNGTIRAKEVKVESNWSDFVFEESYNLPSLNHVESYIKENKHLPDIPSAKEVEKEGLSMADMMKKQMQKIEELTLYVIEQNKKLETVIKENEQLKSRMSELENEK